MSFYQSSLRIRGAYCRYVPRPHANTTPRACRLALFFVFRPQQGAVARAVPSCHAHGGAGAGPSILQLIKLVLAAAQTEMDMHLVSGGEGAYVPVPFCVVDGRSPPAYGPSRQQTHPCTYTSTSLPTVQRIGACSSQKKKKRIGCMRASKSVGYDTTMAPAPTGDSQRATVVHGSACMPTL